VAFTLCRCLNEGIRATRQVYVVRRRVSATLLLEEVMDATLHLVIVLERKRRRRSNDVDYLLPCLWYVSFFHYLTTKRCRWSVFLLHYHIRCDQFKLGLPYQPRSSVGKRSALLKTCKCSGPSHHVVLYTMMERKCFTVYADTTSHFEAKSMVQVLLVTDMASIISSPPPH
jgi:hypothetical protein